MIDRVSLTNPFQGTESHFGFSTGNTYPVIACPFGMNFWSPQTNESNWFYRRSDRLFQGIRCTHQPSPWIRDYGHFVIMPFTGDFHPQARVRASGFRPLDDEKAHAHEYRIFLRRYETMCEVTPTERGAVMCFTFPSGSGGIQVSLFDAPGEVRIDPTGQTISGLTRANSGGVPDNFACYFVMTFDAPCISYGVSEGNRVLTENASISATQAGAYVLLNPDHPVTLRVATSFISEEQAWRNLHQEIGTVDYETIRERAADKWNAYLNRAEIHSTELEQRKFYTALYRSLLFPRMFHEYDETGHPIHYSPFNGQIHDGVSYTDNGFWDTYRTVYPLYALLFPDRLSEILNGWLNAYHEGGWLPTWASPGYRECMIGTHSDSIFADAAVKNIQGIDWAVAYTACRKNGMDITDNKAYGRLGLSDYLERGYIPLETVHEAVSCTLDFAYNDFCIAQLARKAGQHDEAAVFEARGQNYRNLFDPQTGFMRGRTLDGSWENPFHPVRWGGGYVEGSAWQHRFAVPHDIDGLMSLLGGPQALVSALDEMLSMPPSYEVGTYPYEIHEMTEMAAANFGQYAHSNQPVHHNLYLYAYAGQPRKTYESVHRVLNEMYTIDTLPGDEDNGEMSAWYVLSSLGLYPTCPGKPVYTVTAPLHSQSALRFVDGRSLEITAAPLDAAPLEISHEEVIQGGGITLPQI